jgi:hypothetical protein
MRRARCVAIARPVATPARRMRAARWYASRNTGTMNEIERGNRMSARRQLLIVGSAVVGFVFGVGSAGVASAKPSFAINNNNSCRDGCHVTVETGRMQVIGGDGLLDLGTQLGGQMRGPLTVFNVEPGNTVTLTMEVLNGDALFAVQLKRLEQPGQLVSLDNFLTWLEDNIEANVWTPQEAPDRPYFTKDDGDNGGLSGSEAGPFSFDLFVDAATPPDVYDLEFAVAGVSTNEDLFYQDNHFYLQVVPEPAAGASVLAAISTLVGVHRARRRRAP